MHKKVILIPRPPSDSTTELVTALDKLGFDVIAAPLIAIENIPDIKLRTYEQFCEFDWIVCVSDKAVNSWVDAINDFRPSGTMTEGFNKSLPLHGLPPIWVPGSTTAACVEEHGGEAKCPQNGVGSPAIYADMLEKIHASGGDANQLRDKKILLVCGEGGGQEFDQLLGRATPKEIVYRTITRNKAGVDYLKYKLANDSKNIDYVWVTSGSILKALEYLANYPGPSHIAYGHTQIIAGSQRLGSLAKDFKDKKTPKANGSFQGNIITLPEPTNQQLLRYLEDAIKPANKSAIKSPRKNNA